MNLKKLTYELRKFDQKFQYGFEKMQSLSGALSQLNVWSKKLSKSQIKALSQCSGDKKRTFAGKYYEDSNADKSTDSNYSVRNGHGHDFEEDDDEDVGLELRCGASWLTDEPVRSPNTPTCRICNAAAIFRQFIWIK